MATTETANTDILRIGITSERMFLYSPAAPTNMRYAILNPDHTKAKGILNAAKRYAAVCWKDGNIQRGGRREAP